MKNKNVNSCCELYGKMILDKKGDEFEDITKKIIKILSNSDLTIFETIGILELIKLKIHTGNALDYIESRNELDKLYTFMEKMKTDHNSYSCG